MTSPVISVAEECSLDDVLAKMEEHQIRRVPVLTAGGCIAGSSRRPTSPSMRRKARPASWSRKSRATQCTKSAAFSPIITHAACVVAFTTSGITDASAMRRPSTPRTRSCGSTTAAVSVAGPILQVPAPGGKSCRTRGGRTRPDRRRWSRPARARSRPRASGSYASASPNQRASLHALHQRVDVGLFCR